MARVRSLFSLVATHEHHAGGVCPDVYFVPTRACRGALMRSGLLLRTGEGGVSVFYEAVSEDALPDRGEFDFWAYSRDGDFLRYTDIRFNDEERYLYFDSRRAGEGGRLSQGEHAAEADMAEASEIPQELLYWQAPPLFMVRIVTGEEWPAGTSYAVPFRARRTTWRYYVSGKGVNGADFYVAAASGEEAFDYQGEVVLPNERPASLYGSRGVLPLLRESGERYSLRERFNGHVVVRNLPLPAAGDLSRDAALPGEGWVSPVFVNL